MHTKHLPFPNLQLHTNRTRLTCTLVCFREVQIFFQSQRVERNCPTNMVLLCLDIFSKQMSNPCSGTSCQYWVGIGFVTSHLVHNGKITWDPRIGGKKDKTALRMLLQKYAWKNAFTSILTIYCVEMFRKPVVLKTSRLFGPTFTAA